VTVAESSVTAREGSFDTDASGVLLRMKVAVFAALIGRFMLRSWP